MCQDARGVSAFGPPSDEIISVTSLRQVVWGQLEELIGASDTMAEEHQVTYLSKMVRPQLQGTICPQLIIACRHVWSNWKRSCRLQGFKLRAMAGQHLLSIQTLDILKVARKLQGRCRVCDEFNEFNF